MDPQTIQYSREAFNEFNSISQERIYGEWNKWATKGIYPSKGLQVLVETGWIKGFPELEHLANCSESNNSDVEGNWLEQTGRVCDELAKITQPHNFLSHDELVVLMLSALCHRMEPKEGLTLELLSSGDRVKQLHVANNTKAFLSKINVPNHIVSKVISLTLNSQMFKLIESPTEVDVSRLSVSVAPASIKLWFLLCSAIQLATPRLSINNLSANESPCKSESIPSPYLRESQFSQIANLAQWFNIAEKLNFTEDVPVPLISGRDLLNAGFKPSKEMGTLLTRLYDDQIGGLFHSKEEGLDRVKLYI